MASNNQPPKKLETKAEELQHKVKLWNEILDYITKLLNHFARLREERRKRSRAFEIKVSDEVWRVYEEEQESEERDERMRKISELMDLQVRGYSPIAGEWEQDRCLNAYEGEQGVYKALEEVLAEMEHEARFEFVMNRSDPVLNKMLKVQDEVWSQSAACKDFEEARVYHQNEST